MRPQPHAPIHRCMNCDKRSLTLYCDACAPPMTPQVETFDFSGDRRRNHMDTANDGHVTGSLALSPAHRVRAAY